LLNRTRVLLALALALTTPRRAFAAPSDDATEDGARAEGEEGLRRFQAGRWREAYESFRAASEKKQAPTLLLYMAHCRLRLNDLRLARKLYREVTRMTIADGAPLQFTTAKSVARQELEKLNARLGAVKVSIVGPPRSSARVVIDGAEVAEADLDDYGLEPGKHTVQASLPNVEPVQRQVVTEAGHSVEVVLELPVPPPPPEPPEPPPAAPPAPALPPKPPPRDLLVPGYATIGAGAAGLLVGAITGGVSLSTANAVRSRCTASGHCLASDASSAATAGNLADVSTAAFVVGGVAAAAGAALVIVHVKQHKANADEERAAVSIHVHATGAWLHGAF
jgi:hypothetical protein